ncbi:MAG: hypothetical protein AAF569_07160 [Pseudomonadota bacterium]
MSENTPQPLDQDLQSKLEKKALKTVRALSAGNGVKAENVRLNKFEPFSYDAKASVHFLIEPDVQLKTMHGKHAGEVYESQEEADQNVRQYLNEIVHDSAFHESLKQTALSRKDMGLGMDNKKPISMNNFQRSLVWYEGCNTCQTKGQVTCHACHGHRQVRCTKCDGTRKIHCFHCNGTGRLKNGNTEKQCHFCYGTGQMQCDLCRGSGKIPCRTCGARGYLKCNNCSGTGWFTHNMQVIIKAGTQFRLNPENIPDKVKPLFNQKLGKLVENKMIKVETDQEGIHHEKENMLSLSYDLNFPYGEIDFLIKDKPLKASVFGYQGKLVNMPPFIDGLIRSGLKKLENAAHHKGDIPTLLKEAGRYKIIALGLLQAARHSANRTAYVLKKKYPMGVSDKTIEAIAKMADKATSDITKKPRYIGLAIGLVLSAFSFAGYMFSPAQSFVTERLGSTNIEMIFDALIVGVFAYICIFISQMVAKNAMQTALGHLLPPDKRAGLIPKAGEAAYFAIGGCIVLFLAMSEISLITGMGSAPEWYSSFRGVQPIP